MSELNKQNNNVKKSNKIVSKFVAKLIKYIILFKDIVTFLGLDYRDALLITLYLVVIGISIPKILCIGSIIVFTLSKLYLADTVIMVESSKFILLCPN